MELKIIGWTNFDCEYPTRKVGVEDLNNTVALIREEICEKGYIFGGEDHQYAFTGVPVFSDGTCFRASMRCWGSIMAPLFVDSNGQNCSYMDFYMSFGDEAIMPECSIIDKSPATNVIESDGCTLKQDRDIIDESLAFGMEFVTTDKVLKKLYERKKKEMNIE